MTDNQQKIIDEAYDLYMPQVKYEIEEFYEFLNEHYQNRTDESYNVLEIGTKFGGTFYLWCMMNTSGGLNISIDMNDGGLHGGIDEEKMDQRDNWFTERFGNCKFIRGDSHKPITISKLVLVAVMHGVNFEPVIGDIIGQGNLEPFIDFLFIDGDHTYSGVKQDFEMYSPFVKKGGYIAFHDIKDTPKHRERQVEVEKFWNELNRIRMSDDPSICMIDGNEYQILEFSDPSVDWGGIGVLILK